MLTVTDRHIAALEGHDPNLSPDDAIREVIRVACGAESEFNANPASEYSEKMRDVAIDAYEMEFGEAVRWKGEEAKYQIDVVSIVCRLHGFLSLTQDAIIYVVTPYGWRNAESAKGIADAAKTDKIMARCHAQMLAAGANFCLVWAWCPAGGEDFMLAAKYGDIFKGAGLHRVIDAYNDPATRDAALEPKRIKIEDENAEQLVDEYEEMKAAEANAKERQREIMDDLISLSGGRDVEIAGRKLTRVVRKGSVDYSKFAKKHAPDDVDWEKWRRKGSESWRLT